MNADPRRLYSALTARDARFDGVFFVGVTSTDIYCRPICPAKTPKASNCRFFATPQQAEQEGFRPCLRCRPELAPGSAPVDDGQRIAQLIVERLEEGQFDDKAGLVAAVKKLAKGDLWVDRLNEDKGLEHVSNQKLLRLHDVLTTVKSEFGSREKLIDQLLAAENRSKDEDYRKRFEAWPTPRLLDSYRRHAPAKS